jgi:hypothetical protein
LENERIPEDNIKLAVVNMLIERGLVYQTWDIVPLYVVGTMLLNRA